MYIEVEPTNDIAEVKTKIYDKEGKPPERQRLIFDCIELHDGKTVQDYSIPKDSAVLLVLRL
jgi:hypothetical protein